MERYDRILEMCVPISCIGASLRKENAQKKFEEGFYKPGATPVQAAPVEAEPTISVSALLELLKDADPAVKAQLRLALLT